MIKLLHKWRTTSLINLDILKLNALPIIAGVSFAGGLFISHLYHTALEAHQTKVLLEQVEKQKDLDGKVIVDLQTNLDTLQKSYITIGEKLREIKSKKNDEIIASLK